MCHLILPVQSAVELTYVIGKLHLVRIGEPDRVCDQPTEPASLFQLLYGIGDLCSSCGILVKFHIVLRYHLSLTDSCAVLKYLLVFDKSLLWSAPMMNHQCNAINIQQMGSFDCVSLHQLDLSFSRPV